MKTEIISLIRHQRENGITWDDIQKNILSKFEEEYTISEIRKNYMSTFKNIKENNKDDISTLSLTFDDDNPESVQFIEQPIQNDDEPKKDINLELKKLQNENSNLRIALYENDKKFKNEIDKKIKEITSEKDTIIDNLNYEIESLKEEVDHWEYKYNKYGSNYVHKLERDGYLEKISERDIIIDKLKRFKKVTYYIIMALISSGIIAGLWYYYFLR